MANLTRANVQDITDNIGYSYLTLLDVIGDADTGDTILGNIQDNIDRIQSLIDEDKQRYIQDAHLDILETITVEKMLEPYFRSIISALYTNLTKSVSEWWDEQETSYRLSYEYAKVARACGFPIDPLLVYPPVTILGTEALSAENEGDFTDGVAVDSNLYGAGEIEVEVINQAIGAKDVLVTVTGTDENDKENTWTCTITALSIAGTKFNLLTEGDIKTKCYDITDCTIEDGNTGDDFQIQTKVDRDIEA